MTKGVGVRPEGEEGERGRGREGERERGGEGERNEKYACLTHCSFGKLGSWMNGVPD